MDLRTAPSGAGFFLTLQSEGPRHAVRPDVARAPQTRRPRTRASRTEETRVPTVCTLSAIAWVLSMHLRPGVPRCGTRGARPSWRLGLIWLGYPAVMANAIRLGKGGKPLGFLNPFLYKHADAFNDVTHGVNDEGSSRHGGFAAVPGWDPATGLGTPNFAKLAAVV